MSASVVAFEDETVRIIYEPGTIPEAVISFTGIGSQMGGLQKEEFRNSLSGNHMHVYYVIDKGRTWYNACFDRLRDWFTIEVAEKKYLQIFTIGNSMGGFGALLFASHIPGCRSAIAFVPQTSIAPNVVTMDQRYRAFSREISSWVVPDLIPHLSDQICYHVVVGENDRYDLWHADRLKHSAAKGMRLYIVKGSDHNVARNLKTVGVSLSNLTRSFMRAERLPLAFENILVASSIEDMVYTLPNRSIGTLTNNMYRNKIEVQVFGLQRSGNHALLSWLFQQFPEKVAFLNNVDHFKDPFLNFREGTVPNMIRLSKNNPIVTEKVRVSPKECLTISYENLNLSLLPRRDVIPDHDATVGASGSIKRILLLRDFFNWASSRLKLFEYRNQDVEKVINNFEGLIDLWLLYAREFSGETQFLGNRTVTVNYGRWSTDAEYRAYILGRLEVDLVNNDSSHVPEVGGGSSFDTTKFSGKASDMQINGRWRYLLEPKFAVALAKIEERRTQIEFYNRKVFGVDWALDDLRTA